MRPLYIIQWRESRTNRNYFNLGELFWENKVFFNVARETILK